MLKRLINHLLLSGSPVSTVGSRLLPLVPQDKVRDLGIILDSRLNMEAHVANVVRC